MLSQYGSPREEKFEAFGPRRSGTEWALGGEEAPDEPEITVTIDSLYVVEIHIPAAPNPLFSGEHSFNIDEMSEADIIEEIRSTIEDALDGPE